MSLINCSSFYPIYLTCILILSFYVKSIPVKPLRSIGSPRSSAVGLLCLSISWFLCQYKFQGSSRICLLHRECYKLTYELGCKTQNFLPISLRDFSPRLYRQYLLCGMCSTTRMRGSLYVAHDNRCFLPYM